MAAAKGDLYPMATLITRGAGFIGLEAVRLLIENGRKQLVISNGGPFQKRQFFLPFDYRCGVGGCIPYGESVVGVSSFWP